MKDDVEIYELGYKSKTQCLEPRVSPGELFPPRCNEKPGHEGPHRYTHSSAYGPGEVREEWT